MTQPPHPGAAPTASPIEANARSAPSLGSTLDRFVHTVVEACRASVQSHRQPTIHTTQTEVNSTMFDDMDPAQAESAWGRTGGHDRDAARRRANQGSGIQTAFSARTDKIELQGIDERGILDKDVYHEDILEL